MEELIGDKDTSRRDFIKKSAQTVVAATVAVYSTPTVNAAAPSENLTAKPAQQGAPKANPPPSQIKPPKPPGWHPDPPDNDGNYFFTDEAIFQHRSQGFDAFPTPGSFPSGDPFEEASDKAWILGVPFKKKENDKFDDLIEEIAKKARHYNAALYWMRRLHFHEKVLINSLAVHSAPPRNLHGDDDSDGPDWKDWDLSYVQGKVKSAQTKWNTAVGELKEVLDRKDSPFQFKWVDMIQVNGYIVSMRVVTRNDSPIGEPGVREFGGSSSSHVSITSPFSSP
jgi:hypothetical protein